MENATIIIDISWEYKQHTDENLPLESIKGAVEPSIQPIKSVSN